jgi:DNA-binding HxlR family transcriptional regulator
MHDPDNMLEHADCPRRLLLEQVLDKWSVMIIVALSREPLRFNALKRRFDGITPKVLTQTLRRLERNGMVERHVFPTSPVSVEYRITPVGRTLEMPFEALASWTIGILPEVERAREVFDGRAEARLNEV